jgi:hypothetical protein
MVSPDEMRKIVAGTGWHVARAIADADGRFVAVIGRE